MDTVTVALWATNLAVPLNGVDAWAARVDARMAEAKAEGADMLVMPEYAAEQWLSFAPEGIAPTEEVPWLARQAPAALAAVANLPAKHGMALLPGTMPIAAAGPQPDGSRYRNRAWLLLPDGRRIAQDKLVLTPGETNPAAWNLAAGARVEIVRWHGLRLATLVCLDIEMPSLVHRLAPYGLDLVLVPSMTEKPSGNARVFSCAKARAIELQAAVCAVGCVGKAAASKPRESNTGAAAAYLPCEPALGYTGVHAEIAPSDRPEGAGPMLIARDLPIAELRALRRGGAEVWPGAWSAAHVAIVEDGADSRADRTAPVAEHGSGPDPSGL